jgi:hypothetical protein
MKDRPRKTKLGPPRNYRSRREQFRLFMIVGGLFLVIIFIRQARNPERWRWLTGEKTATDNADLNTRLLSVTEGGTGDLPGTIIAKSFSFRPDSSLDDEARAERRAEKDIWKQQLESLSWSERREFGRVLKAVRDGTPLTDEQALGWTEMVGLLDERWQSHLAEARETVTSDTKLSDEDKATWLQILHKLGKQWEEELHAAFAAAANPAKLDAAQKKSLEQFQSLYDEMAMEEVRDDTVISRPSEVPAWFHSWTCSTKLPPRNWRSSTRRLRRTWAFGNFTSSRKTIGAGWCGFVAPRARPTTSMRRRTSWASKVTTFFI